MTDVLRGTDFVARLPERAGRAREDAIIEAVKAGHLAPICWVPVHSEHGGRRATFFVSADALRIGDPQDSVRINATARTTQQIADLLECAMPTTRICDLVWEQASVRIKPCIGAPDPTMASTARMLEHHRRVEERIAGRTGLIENVGKHWVLTNRLAGSRDRAANYGWYDQGAAHRHGAHALWQPLGLAHDLDHVDYSQVVRLVRRRCLIDDAERDLFEVLTDPALARLASSEGPLRVLRQPGVPEGA
ncbi:hypothetical protein SOCE26_058750 [Sorangium cellulosum]|uniref:Uncharacterized protein n=1 Tax=Sorangium cellulosum TaxID=56 RepID=A0A2L0EYL8_SORCE|nr:hypothetical protein [Sorangium cellulosum]AUX44411.1 hypothetical protein SOCE26_058750 [Sorangium cellulosum]